MTKARRPHEDFPELPEVERDPPAAGPPVQQNLPSERVGETVIEDLVEAQGAIAELADALESGTIAMVMERLTGFARLSRTQKREAISDVIEQIPGVIEQVGVETDNPEASSAIIEIVRETDLEKYLSSLLRAIDIDLPQETEVLSKFIYQVVVKSAVCKYLLSLVSNPSCRLEELIASLWPEQCDILENLVKFFIANDPARKWLPATHPKRVKWQAVSGRTGQNQIDHPKIVFYEREYLKPGVATVADDQIVGFGYPITEFQTQPEYGIWIRFTNAMPTNCPPPTE